MRTSTQRLTPALATLLLLLSAVVLHACRAVPDPSGPAQTAAAASSKDRPILLDSIGPLRHPISTESTRAQRYFDQGLTLTFGFNHEGAIRSFEEALRLDPKCGMCKWGIALALGPNINAPMGPEAAKRAYQVVQEALVLAQATGSDREQAYVRALMTRYSEDPPEDRSALDRAYADAMRELHRADPQDHDAAALFAEALMDLYPWAYWTPEGEPKEWTDEIIATLESILENAPDHVGANHYYIHAVEEFYPERGEPAADRLGDLSPDAGHLVHMPSHIYWRVGRYEDAAEINQRAAAADERFFAWCRAGAFYQVAYYPHNLHFLWAAAAAEGRRDLALMTARKLAAATRPALQEVPILEEFVAIPMLTMARFGLWDELLGEPEPDADAIYLSGISQYTRGLAQSRTGRVEQAKASLARLSEKQGSESAEALILSGGTATAAALLEIAALHLESEIAIAEEQKHAAIEPLRRATELHDALPYMEPPPWYSPPRQLLGAVLVDLGRVAEAEGVYREDLRQYPKNGWSLLGLAQSLRAQGQTAKADWARKGFEEAWRRADVSLSSSRL